MNQKPKNPRSDKNQVERFQEAARAVGADEDEAAFRAKLAAIARHKPVAGPMPRSAKSKPQAKPRKGK